MGLFGDILGGFGKDIGRFAGKHLGKFTGINEDLGGQIGNAVGPKLGSLIPYKKGGRVKRTGKALVHKGEYVLPKGVKPTKAQIKKVLKGKKKKVSKKCKRK